jgi:hypothetical protein
VTSGLPALQPHGLCCLWKIASTFSHVVLRSPGCKLFWHGTGQYVPAFTNGAATASEFKPVVTVAEQPQLESV